MTYRLLFAVLLTLTMGFGGVSRAQSTDTGIIAVVNGEAITEAHLMMFYQSLPQQYRQVSVDTLRGQILDSLIERKLLSQAARKASLLEDDDVKQRLDYLVDDVLQQAYLGRIIEARATEDNLRAAYDAMIADFEPADEVRARHILLDNEADARAVIAALDAGGDFAELAKQRSTGPSGANGGDLGYFVRERMVAPFATAAFAMAVGDMSSEPVKTEFGWHVIKVEDRRPASPPSYQSVRDGLRTQEAQAALADAMVELHAGAEIERFDNAAAE
jgi:peptidyl-prolyl cis-trans isomerase C